MDRVLVERGLADSRVQAADLVERGLVVVSGAPAAKPSRLVGPGEPVAVREPDRYVGRGGRKLEAALARFGIDPRGLRCLDAGASTGGFTDCLLQHGARAVAAVDVGHGQLHQRLRTDGRVEVWERTDVRSIGPEVVGAAPFDLVVADLSFISATAAAPVLAGPAVAPAAPIILLVKPQFEAGRAAVSRGRGVVRDLELHRRAIVAVGTALADAGAGIMGVMASPVPGHAGNREYFLHATAPAPGRHRQDAVDAGTLARWASDAVDEVARAGS